jgi:hypothetical protein
MFDIDLKTEFNPSKVQEDMWIEDILVRTGLSDRFFDKKIEKK